MIHFRFVHYFLYLLMVASLVVFDLFLISIKAVYGQSGPRNGRPPAAAFIVCAGKSSGASCHFDAARGTLNGICSKPMRGSRLVCVPNKQRDQHRHSSKSVPHFRSGRTRPHAARQHTVIQSTGDISLVPANEQPISQTIYSSTIEGEWRVIRFNAVADHKTGQFPNQGNPHRISEQNFTIKVPANPEYSGIVQEVKEPGIAFSGVPFDPAAGEFYLGNRQSGWQYEALSGAISLGLDTNHAHVQPTGKYHYHGLPLLLMKELGVRPTHHSPQIGWAIDGFPIYALYGYQDRKSSTSSIITMQSSYRLKAGNRTRGKNQPGGTYDGTFTKDYEFVKGAGNLDECNGIWSVTPEYPQGTYAYFLTPTFPVVPRCVKGKIHQNQSQSQRRRPRS